MTTKRDPQHMPVRKMVRQAWGFMTRKTQDGIVVVAQYPELAFEGGKRSIVVPTWHDAWHAIHNRPAATA